MKQTELEHLIKMANDIANNLAHGDGDEAAAARIAAHLKRFWAPAMRRQLIAYQNSDGSGLLNSSRLAVQQLAREQAS